MIMVNVNDKMVVHWMQPADWTGEGRGGSRPGDDRFRRVEERRGKNVRIKVLMTAGLKTPAAAVADARADRGHTDREGRGEVAACPPELLAVDRAADAIEAELALISGDAERVAAACATSPPPA
jgi:hypothetical protein